MSVTCSQCSTALTGKQQRFCSNKCRNDYWTKARKRGENAVLLSGKEATQALLNDLFRVLKDHKHTIATLGDEDETS